MAEELNFQDVPLLGDNAAQMAHPPVFVFDGLDDEAVPTALPRPRPSFRTVACKLFRVFLTVVAIGLVGYVIYGAYVAHTGLLASQEDVGELTSRVQELETWRDESMTGTENMTGSGVMASLTD